MGTLLPIIVVGVAYLVLLLVLTCCVRCAYFRKLRDYLRRIRRVTFFNRILAFWDGIQLTVTISACLNIQQCYVGALELDASFIASIIVLTLVAFVQPTIILIVMCKFKELGIISIRRWIGVFYEDLSTKKHGMLLYVVLYFSRIVVLAFITVSLE